MSKLSIVKLLHAGAEHGTTTYPRKDWNTAEHKRKFVRWQGNIAQQDGTMSPQELLTFWCEWEAPSIIGHEFANYSKYLPRYRHDGLLIKLPQPQGAQNTDPCVFGEQFYYGCCRQQRGGNLTSLAKLDKGSLILFGSNLRDEGNKDIFVLDTVFVVVDWVDYNLQKPLIGIQDPRLTPEYHEIFSKCTGNMQGRLYFGATPQNSFEGMFSYVPAQPFEEGQTSGFERPRISLNGMSLGQKMGFQNIKKNCTIEEIQDAWKEVWKQVHGAGCVAGVNFPMPQISPTSVNNATTVSTPRARC